MAIGTTAKVTRALLQHLRGLTVSPAITVAWPDDREFVKPVSGGVPQPYLEAKLFRAPTETLSVDEGGANAVVGFLQVNVVYPDGAGIMTPSELADLVILHFQRGTVLTEGDVKVLIDKAPYAMTPIDDKPYTKTPVTIRYQAFAPQ